MALQRTTIPTPQAATTDDIAGVASLRTLGTGAQQAAAGNHNHAGAYASTAHADTHASDGSDPITAGSVLSYLGETSTPSAPGDDSHVKFYFRWMGYKSVPAQRSLDREMLFGSVIHGPGNLFLITPNTGTSNPLPHFGPADFTGTIGHTASTGRGWRSTLSTAASTNATASAASTDLRWTRGDSSTLPFGGYYMHCRFSLPDASYANTGASTGQRFFVGFTDQTVATMLGSDNAAGHRHGFELINVNGGKTQTTFQMVTRNGTTEALLDSTIGFTTTHVYDVYIHIRPNGGYAFGQINNVSNGTTSGPLIDVAGSASVPGNTTFMRAMVGIQTINATARRFDLNRLGVEVGP